MAPLFLPHHKQKEYSIDGRNDEEHEILSPPVNFLSKLSILSLQQFKNANVDSYAEQEKKVRQHHELISVGKIADRGYLV